MNTSRFATLIAAAAVSVGALTAVVAPASIAQAQPKETFMCWYFGNSYAPGTKIPGEGTTMMCQKDGSWKYIGANH